MLFAAGAYASQTLVVFYTLRRGSRHVPAPFDKPLNMDIIEAQRLFYEYEALGEDMIKILALFPSGDPQSIQCRLYVVNLANPPHS